MQIIKKGRLPEDREYALECNHCKTEFKFKQSEGEYVHDQRDGNFVRIACPFCGRNCYTYPGKTSSMTKSELAKPTTRNNQGAK